MSRPPRRGFDRIKPPADRLLERPEAHEPAAGRADPEGRAALFSQGRGPGRSVSGLTLHCSRCDATSPLNATTAVRSALPLFLVAPWKTHCVFAVCPACRRRAWLRPRLEP